MRLGIAIGRGNLERLAQLALGCSIGASAALIGGVPAGCLVAVAGIACASLALQIYTQRYLPSPASLVLVALAVWSIAYSLPLPKGLVSLLSPYAANVWLRAEQLTELPLPARLGLEPEAARLLGLQLLLCAAIWGGVRGDIAVSGRPFVTQSVCLTGLFVAGATLCHTFLGFQSVYGLYHPLYAIGRQWIGPLLNPNNLSGLMNLSGFCAVSLLLREGRSSPRAYFLGLAAALLFATGIATGSRGGTIALALGCLTLSLRLLWLRHRNAAAPREEHSGTLAPLLGSVVATTLGFSALGVSVGVWRELADPSVDKLKGMGAAFAVISASPWFGYGPSGFSVAFHSARTEFTPFRREYVESFILDWAATWGCPVAVVLCAALLWFLIRRFFAVRRAYSVALWVGCSVVIAQNLVDLAFFVPGVLVPLVAILASLERPKRGQRPFKLAPLLKVPLALALSALTLASAYDLPRPGRVERKQMGQAAFPSLPQVKDATTRHPGDAYFLRLGALAAMQSPDVVTSLRWANAAIAADPTDGRTYLMTAEILQRLGKMQQALLTLRSAARDTNLAPAIADRISTWQVSDYRATLPLEPRTRSALLIALAGREPDLKVRLSLLREAPPPVSPELHLALAKTYLELMTRRVAPCEIPDECRVEVAAALSVGMANVDTLPRALPLQARALALAGKTEQGLSLLLSQCPRGMQGFECAQTALQLVDALPDVSPLRRDVVQFYVTVYCQVPDRCPPALDASVTAHFRHREYGDAYAYARRAADTYPTPENILRAASLALQLRRNHEARRWLERLPEGTPSAFNAAEKERLRKAILDAETAAVLPNP